MCLSLFSVVNSSTLCTIIKKCFTYPIPTRNLVTTSSQYVCTNPVSNVIADHRANATTSRLRRLEKSARTEIGIPTRV